MPDVGWVAAKDLHAGSHLQTKSESWLDVDRVERRRWRRRRSDGRCRCRRTTTPAPNEQRDTEHGDKQTARGRAKDTAPHFDQLITVQHTCERFLREALPPTE